MIDVAAVFAADGPLADALAGYRPRQEQLALATAVAKAIAEQTQLVAEAATGTGKTFAYLAPAMLDQGRTIVSTGTKTLQDQLFQNDIPRLRQALKLPINVALLKGRANYVCHYHLEQTQALGRLVSRDEIDQLRQIERFAKSHPSGDKAACHGVPEQARIWNDVTSSRDNCLGQDCPHHSKCFVLSARKEAMAADLVVVNHHLFFADLVLRDEGVAELLPNSHTVIFDEAHQLPDIAAVFFGDHLASSQVLELARDVRNLGLLEARDCPALQEQSSDVDKATRDVRLSLDVAGSGAFAVDRLKGNPAFWAAMASLSERLRAMGELLATQAERSAGFAQALERCSRQIAQLSAWQNEGSSDSVRWLELFASSLSWRTTPLDVAPTFQKLLSEQQRSWIFTSATLAIGKQLHHFCHKLGLTDAALGCWQGSFNYPEQALLYVPTGLPLPSQPLFTAAMVKAMLPILRVIKGGAFVLCTTLRAMREAHALLTTALADDPQLADYLLLLQGSEGKHELLQRFREHGHAILVGSQSFWEGVDVQGQALSLVVIDKIPFAPPDDPVTAMRIARLHESGHDPFMDFQLPEAVIQIKQGAGRLIRSETDRGVLMIADPRLIEKFYGKYIWRSLPPMKRTRQLDEVLAFWR